MQEPHFDLHQFYNPHARPVSASTHLSYEDYWRMSTRTHKQSNMRRLPTPEWALDDLKLREVLVRFLEHRAYGYAVQKTSGSLAERIMVAQAEISLRRKQKTAALKELHKEYMALLGKNHKAPARRKVLDVQIENIDTFLSTTARDGGLAKAAAVVVLYHRCRLDSVGVGQQLNLKPNHVRQLLYRLAVIARKLGYENPA